MKVPRSHTISALALIAASALLPLQARANHPVLVEGNNAGNDPAVTTVPPGTGGDFDGDGLIGTAEDTDNATDRVFGTLTAALGSANGGANGNGRVTIVTSGRFPEAIDLSGGAGASAGQTLNGVLVIEAAPGVVANIDAVLAGDAAGTTAREALPGILIETAQTDRAVILRNLVVRNWAYGLLVRGGARVTVEDCKFDSNLAANVSAEDRARLTMTECSISAGGMRFTAAGKAAPDPGNGVEFEDSAGGSLFRCTVSSNTAAGVLNTGTGRVRLLENNVFDNGIDFRGRF